MKTTIYFLRHAESDQAVRDAKTRPLTEKGQRDAERLTGFFRDIPISRIFSSPYLRAVQTVTPLSREKNLPIAADERMKEWMGGRPFSNEFFESRMRAMFEDEKSTHGGAESLKALKKRTLEFTLHLLSRFPGETIVVGTHALALTAAVKNFHDEAGLDFLLKLLPVAPFAAVLEFENFSLSSVRCFDPFQEGMDIQNDNKGI